MPEPHRRPYRTEALEVSYLDKLHPVGLVNVADVESWLQHILPSLLNVPHELQLSLQGTSPVCNHKHGDKLVLTQRTLICQCQEFAENSNSGQQQWQTISGKSSILFIAMPWKYRYTATPCNTSGSEQENTGSWYLMK